MVLIVIRGQQKDRWRALPAPAPRLGPTALRNRNGDAPAVVRESATPARAQRMLNVAAAVLLLLAAAPLMVVVALAVKLTSPGPVLFTQPRVGLDRRRGWPAGRFNHQRSIDYGGRLFRIYKFRTMTHPKDRGQKQSWARPDDPRITPLGRILRKTRLDELPQLFNVLKGDMNIVGPRPEQPEIFRKLRKEIPEYSYRQRVLPGITGWAQVNRHYDRCIADVRRKVALDLEYIHRQSAMEDLRIMVRTVPVMLFQRGSV
jgi:lipopolysaccharide/colanic/teichoic acid biosynthesis glycosyltransferase